MQTFQTKVTQIAEQNQQVATIRKPFILPPTGGEAVFSYVVLVKPDAEIDYIDVGGVHFAKYVMLSESTYVKNEGRQFFPMIPCSAMTERQASAILERAKEVEIEIPGKDGESGWNLGKKAKASDYVILCKTGEYNTLQNASPRIDSEKNIHSSPDPLDIRARDKAFTEERKKR
jgi:hypothetical protein